VIVSEPSNPVGDGHRAALFVRVPQ
jgi:hypothetical protein